MGRLHPLDILSVVVYFTVVMAIGIYVGRFTQSTADFFLAGQRFRWWVIAASCVATLVGSYSFINYSDLGYDHGFSSAVYYTNDWFILPIYLMGWLPIFYFGRILSVPEYFERRFDRRTRVAVLVVALVFLIGYIGMNLQTIGVALHRITGLPVPAGALLIGVLSILYMHHGGQMSVLATDLFQGAWLLATGLLILLLGISVLGGWEPFWNGLAGRFQAPFPEFNRPTGFHFIGSFWGDAMSGTVAFFFVNQGLILRFLSARSVHDGRRAMMATVLVLMPLAAVAVSSGGWIGRAMVGLELPEAPAKEKGIFVTVAGMLCAPGVYGLVLAALLAALMSTLDTYINAAAAIGVNDILKPLRPDLTEAATLRAARFVSLAATAFGFLLVPLFELSDTIYKAHATFFACVNPPLVVLVLLGCLWKRFTSAGAFWGLTIGTGITLLSLLFPAWITPIAHGVAPTENYIYMRALFALLVTGATCVVVTLLTRPRPAAEIEGLYLGTVEAAARRFRGREPARDGGASGPLPAAAGDVERGTVRLPPAVLQKLGVGEGGSVIVEDSRWWLGGLRSVRLRVGLPADGDAAQLHPDDFAAGHLDPARPVRIESV